MIDRTFKKKGQNKSERKIGKITLTYEDATTKNGEGSEKTRGGSQQHWMSDP